VGTITKRPTELSTDPILAAHRSAISYIKRELSMGSPHRLQLLRQHLYNTHIEEAFRAAQKLPQRERKAIALEGIESLIKKGYVADAIQVLKTFKLTEKDAWPVLIRATEALLAEESPHKIKNMETIIASWELFNLSYRNIDPIRLESIRRKSLLFIRYGIEKNREDLSTKLATRLDLFEGREERLTLAVLAAIETKLSKSHGVSIAQIKRDFGIPRDRIAELVLGRVRELTDRGKGSEAIHVYYSSGISRKDREMDLKGRQRSLPI
jgi:hypothetical protein